MNEHLGSTNEDSNFDLGEYLASLEVEDNLWDDLEDMCNGG